MIRVLMIAACSAMLSLSALGQCLAHIYGKVTNWKGEGVVGAQVYLAPTNNDNPPTQAYSVAPVKSTDGGSFDLNRPIPYPGTYTILPAMTDGGYADGRLGFYAHEQYKTFHLACGSTVNHVVAHLGPPVAYIDRIQVRNATTGDPILDAVITLQRGKSPIREVPAADLMLSTSTRGGEGEGDLKLRVPSNVDFLYSIDKPGFLTSQPVRLHLFPGQRVDLRIALRPQLKTSS
jgi:hypothetical protein